MIRKFLSLIILLILLVSIQGSQLVKAQVSGGMDFLRLSPDTYSQAISGANTAVKLGSAALYANPANIRNGEKSDLNIAFNTLEGDVSYLFAGASFADKRKTVALGVYSNVINDIETRINPGPSNGSFDVSYLALTAGIAKSFNKLDYGISASLLMENYLENDAQGYAFNLGLNYRLIKDDKFNIGLSANNLGKMSELINQSTPLPKYVQAGISTKVFSLSEVNVTKATRRSLYSLSVNANLRYNIDDENTTIVGANEIDQTQFIVSTSHNLKDIIIFHLAYISGSNTNRNWSFGAGFKVNQIEAFYTLIPYTNSFGNANGIGLKYNF